MANPPDDHKADGTLGQQETASRATGGSRPADKSSNPRTQNTATNASAKVSTHPQSLVNVPLPFTTLGRYTVLRELGRGGMGTVYLADDTMLKRQVALKIPQFEPGKSEQMQARFVREAQMAASLSHPNICQVFDVAVIDGRHVMAMEYIDGRTLSAYTKPEKLLPERQAVQLVKKVALAVEAAHQKKMIHRDLKPGNIMLAKTDASRKSVEPKVMDFGLAKSLGGGGAELTKSGMILGTPCYMSKEQWSAKDGQVGPASDVYSLGMILYELLTGKLPYEVDDDEPATAWFVRLVTRDQAPLRQYKPGLDKGLESIVMRSIALETEDRYATMTEFAEALDDWIKGGAPDTTQDLTLESTSNYIYSQIDRVSSASGLSGRRSARRLSSGGKAAESGTTSVKSLTTDKTISPANYFLLGIVASIGIGGIIFWLLLSPNEGVDSSVAAVSEITSSAVTSRDDPRILESSPEPASVSGATPSPLKSDTVDISSSTPESEPSGDAAMATGTVPTGTSAVPEAALPKQTEITVLPPQSPEARFVSFALWLKDPNGQSTEGKGRNVQSRSGITVLMLIDMQRQRDLLAKAIGVSEESVEPLLIERVQIERKSAANDFRLVTEQWEPLEWSKLTQILDNSNGVDYEIVNPLVVNSRTTMPLPRRVAGNWTQGNSLHSQLASFELSDIDRPHVDEFRKLFLKNAIELGGFQQNAAEEMHGFQKWSPFLDDALFQLGTERDKILDKTVLDTMQFADSSQPIDESSKLKLEQLLRSTVASSDLTLVRFLDSTCELGNWHTYRVRLEVQNPYLGLPAERLERPELSQPMSLFSDWSDSTPPVFARQDYRYYVDAVAFRPGNTEYADMSMYRQMESAGTPTMASIRVPVGTRIGGTAKVDLVDLGQMTLKKTDVEFTSDDFLVSVHEAPQVSWSEFPELLDSRLPNDEAPWRDRITVIDSNGAIVTRYVGENCPAGPTSVTKDADQEVVDFVVGSYGHLPSEQPLVSTVGGKKGPGDLMTSSQHGAEIITNRIGMKLKLIPAGEFMMGAPLDEPPVFGNEGPQHNVRITKPFYIGVTEVTRGQWFAVMKTKPWKAHYVKEGDNHPVSFVSWHDAVEYCGKLSVPGGIQYRLPTEAEWEYACRGGTSTIYSFGNDAAQLRYYGVTGRFKPNEVTEHHGDEVRGKKANPFGLYDMHGNVSEWCSDWSTQYPVLAVVDPKGPVEGSYRIVRGGGWSGDATSCRSASRSQGEPSVRHPDRGFRVVMSPPGQ